LVAPRVSQRLPGKVLRKAQRVAKRAFGLQVSYSPQLEPIRIERKYELFCLYVQGLGDLDVLDAAPNWRRRCTKAVCFVEELWVRELGRWGRRTLQRLAEFDLIVCGHYGTVAPLRALVDRPCEWSPGGVDALRFFPGLHPPRRTIDLFAMGRRSDESHGALLRDAAAHDWTYLFDTLEPRRVRAGDHEQHRTQLAELVKRSRYFMVNKARVDAIEDIGAQEELGFRSFEGAAGGAVLIGHVPRGKHVDTLFDWPDAHIHVPFHSTEMADVIVSLDRDPERVERIRRDNVVNSLRRHDWSYRWRNVLEILGVTQTERLAQRTQRLHELAALTESGASELEVARRVPVSVA
jgi:hypothetical protein